jgi:hypothetical protein
VAPSPDSRIQGIAEEHGRGARRTVFEDLGRQSIGRGRIVSAHLGEQPTRPRWQQLQVRDVQPGRAHVSHQHVVESLESDQRLLQELGDVIRRDEDVCEAEHHETPVRASVDQ